MSRKLSLKELRKAFENGGDLQNIECDWERLDGYDWSRLLIEQPQFADKCNWKKLDSGGGRWLLRKQPQFADKCDKWDEFEREDWRFILRKQPQLADKCDSWDEFYSDDWRFILSEQPQLADKCDSWDEFDSEDWSLLLSKQPQFADKCNWSKLYSFQQKTLITKHPQLIKYFTVSDIAEIPETYNCVNRNKSAGASVNTGLVRGWCRLEKISDLIKELEHIAEIYRIQL